MGIPLLYIVSGGALLLSIGFILFNGVSGTGKTQVSLAIETVVLTIYLAYAYTLVYVFKEQITSIWTTELVYGSLLALLSFIYLRSNKWRTGSI